MNAKFPMREKSTLPAYHVEMCECKFGVGVHLSISLIFLLWVFEVLWLISTNMFHSI